jgi:hypothetical protein
MIGASSIMSADDYHPFIPNPPTRRSPDRRRRAHARREPRTTRGRKAVRRIGSGCSTGRSAASPPTAM